MSIEISAVSYAYGTSGTGVLQDVSALMPAGKITLLVGASGSGKTTLLHLIAGLDRPRSGFILIDGQVPEVGEVGLLLQRSEEQLFADTVLQDVMFGPINRGETTDQARETACDALEQVGVEATLYDTSPFRLSGGQMRRVAIAGVLAMKAETYLFDEPFAGLDGRGVEDMRTLLQHLASQGAHVVVVTHDIEYMLDYAEKIVVLRKGLVSWSGSTRSLLDHPQLFDSSGLMVPPYITVMQELRKLSEERL